VTYKTRLDQPLQCLSKVNDKKTWIYATTLLTGSEFYQQALHTTQSVDYKRHYYWLASRWMAAAWSSGSVPPTTHALLLPMWQWPVTRPSYVPTSHITASLSSSAATAEKTIILLYYTRMTTTTMITMTMIATTTTTTNTTTTTTTTSTTFNFCLHWLVFSVSHQVSPDMPEVHFLEFPFSYTQPTVSKC